MCTLLEDNFLKQLRLDGKLLQFLGPDYGPGLSVLIASGHLPRILTVELERSRDIGSVAINS